MAVGEADIRAHLRQRLGWRRRYRAARRGRDRRYAAAGGRRYLRRIGGPDLERGAAGLRPHVPDAVLRPHSQRDRHGDDGGRQYFRAGPRQLDPHGRPRRPRVPGAAAPRRSVLDAACRGTPQRPRRVLAAALLRRARSALSALGRPRARGEFGVTPMDLAGKHALVTGGGSGIGAAIALAMAQAGAAVTICGRRMEMLENTATHHREIHAVAADVTDEQSVARLYERARTACGPVDIVVANAGGAQSAPAEKVSAELWTRTLNVNLTGAFFSVKPAL